jgi:hypothetical protein
MIPACYPKYSRVRDWEDYGLRPTQATSRHGGMPVITAMAGNSRQAWEKSETLSEK